MENDLQTQSIEAMLQEKCQMFNEKGLPDLAEKWEHILRNYRSKACSDLEKPAFNN